MIVKDTVSLDVFSAQHLYELPRKYHRTITLLDATDPNMGPFMTHIEGMGSRAQYEWGIQYEIYTGGIDYNAEVPADTPDHRVQPAQRLQAGADTDDQPPRPTPAPVCTTDKDH